MELVRVALLHLLLLLLLLLLLSEAWLSQLVHERGRLLLHHHGMPQALGHAGGAGRSRRHGAVLAAALHRVHRHVGRLLEYATVRDASGGVVPKPASGLIRSTACRTSVAQRRRRWIVPRATGVTDTPWAQLTECGLRCAVEAPCSARLALRAKFDVTVPKVARRCG